MVCDSCVGCFVDASGDTRSDSTALAQQCNCARANKGRERAGDRIVADAARCVRGWWPEGGGFGGDGTC